ncbi:MAG: hypothetical protein V7L01_09540 [Nostoc sp.]|uniref:hypothetical protein n=1 Tax=Nostoc sp. TaxID=1180 RepID=UPI002FF87A54
MNNNSNQPGEFDAVLGGEAQNQNYGVVLGGIEGVQNRLNSEDDEVKTSALEDALTKILSLLRITSYPGSNA